MKIFFLVLARDKENVEGKIEELQNLGVQYKIVCGENLNHPNIVYQAPAGKYAAINFGAGLIPEDTDIVVMNDVDTRIANFGKALQHFKDKNVAVVFGTEKVNVGPTNSFLRILNPIRSKVPIAGTGELMLIRSEVFNKICPLKPCKAEDTYILFKAQEKGYKVVFCESCYAETQRTKKAEQEEPYRRKTVAGIYQALSYSTPPPLTKLFYILLPFISPVLLVSGKKGYYWMRGILLGFLDYARGDRTGIWRTDYMK